MRFDRLRRVDQRCERCDRPLVVGGRVRVPVVFDEHERVLCADRTCEPSRVNAATGFILQTRLRFYRYRLRAFVERVADRLFRIDERCEGCRRALIIAGELREPYAVDNDGCLLCDSCADELVNSSNGPLAS